MKVKKQLSLRLGTFLILFLFTSEEACAEFIIKSVNLITYPRNEVQRGTNVSLICQAEVSQSPGSHPNYEYIFLKDYETLHVEKTNAMDSLYSIPDARVVNSGKYECSVVIENQKKKSSPTDLSVKGLLTPVLIVDSQRLTEGDEVTALCSADGEMGPFVYYFRNGADELYRMFTSSHQVMHNLTLTKGPLNMYCYYSISLGNKIEISNKSNVISIDIQELSIKPDIKVMPSTNVTEGDLLTLSCSVDMTHQRDSKLRISLLRGLTTLSFNMRQDYSMTAKANDSGEYECIADLGAVHKSSSVNITVDELFSVPVLSIYPAEVFEGERFHISCQINRFALLRIKREDIKFSLFKDKTHLVSANEYSAIASKVTNGRYICVAEANDIIKESLIELFRIKVFASKPEITADEPVIVDKPFWIHCHSVNGSLPIVYTLKKNGITLNRTEVSDPQEGARFIATISAPSDIRSYICEAQNKGKASVETSQRLQATVIVPVGKPLLTVIPVPGNIEEGADVTLICGIQKGSPPISFRFYGSNHTPINNITVQSNSSSFVLSAVNRQNSGNYYCEAINLAKILNKSDDITIEVSLATWKKVLIAAFCMLMVALLVLFIVLRYKAQRGKREMAAKLSVKPASPKSDDSLTLTLTHETLYSGHTVGVSNKESVWSEKPPDVFDEDSLQSPNEADVEYTEVVHPQPVDSTRIPLRKGTDTVYSELQTSQGVPEHTVHQGLLEYAELNYDLPPPVD